VKIFCLDSPYAASLKALGHEVLAPKLPAGIVYLPGVLRRHKFTPELFIQHERLGARLLCGGLEELPCPSVFVSIDAHLNLYWHKYYARLFDLVLTPHLSIYAALPADQRPAQVRRFGPIGYARPFVPHAQRAHELTFVGLLTEHRPARAAMLELLSKKFALYRPEGGLPHSAMLDLFMDTRLVPNEAISREVNFRLFEAASCGAMVLSQDVGEDQDAHFEPGLECEIYTHSLELTEKIHFYRRNPQSAEKIALAGWKRVQSAHLPEFRAKQMLEEGLGGRSRATGGRAGYLFWLTLLQTARAGLFKESAAWFTSRLNELNPDLPDWTSVRLAWRLLLFLEGASPDNPLYDKDFAARNQNQTQDLAATLLREEFPSSPEADLIGAMASLALKRQDLARLFWLRRLKALDIALPAAAVVSSGALREPYDHYLAWGKLLSILGPKADVGFNFTHGRGQIPLCAFECLLMAKETAPPKRREWLREIHALSADIPAFAFWDMGFLAELSLLNQRDWRPQLDYGLSALNNYRQETAIYELAEARQKALQRDEGSAFYSELESYPASGYILAALRGTK